MTSNLQRALGRHSLLALALPLLALAMLLSACSDDEGGGDSTEDGDETATVTEDSGTDDETATATEDDATGTATGTSTGTATATGTAGGADGGADGGSEVDLEMIDIAFSVEQIEATAGEPLTVNAENTGALEHDFTIEEGSFSDISAEGGENLSGEEYPIHYVLPAGESGSLTFTADEAGEYTYFCTVAGHREAGMEGTLTVQ